MHVSEFTTGWDNAVAACRQTAEALDRLAAAGIDRPANEDGAEQLLAFRRRLHLPDGAADQAEIDAAVSAWVGSRQWLPGLTVQALGKVLEQVEAHLLGLARSGNAALVNAAKLDALVLRLVYNEHSPKPAIGVLAPHLPAGCPLRSWGTRLVLLGSPRLLKRTDGDGRPLPAVPKPRQWYSCSAAEARTATYHRRLEETAEIHRQGAELQRRADERQERAAAAARMAKDPATVQRLIEQVERLTAAQG
jgi:hypothetical protein